MKILLNTIQIKMNNKTVIILLNNIIQNNLKTNKEINRIFIY